MTTHPGKTLRSLLADTGIDTERLRTSDEPTGLAVISVDEHGENSIIVASGANAAMLDLDAGDLELIRSAKVLVLQLETPVETVQAAARPPTRPGSSWCSMPRPRRHCRRSCWRWWTCSS